MTSARTAAAVAVALLGSLDACSDHGAGPPDAPAAAVVADGAAELPMADADVVPFDGDVEAGPTDGHAGAETGVLVVLVPTAAPGSPVPIVVRTAAGEPVSASLALSIDGAPRGSLALHRGAGSVSLMADEPGARTIEVRAPGWSGASTLRSESREVRALAGRLSGDGLRWGSEADVRLDGSVEIAPGDTLDIGPGARVLVGSRVSLEVRGALRARGTEAAPILFVPSGPAAWGSLRVIAGAVAELDHVWLLGGGGDPAQVFGHSASAPVVRVRDADLGMRGGGILDAPGKAFGTTRARLTLDGVLVSRCDTGGELADTWLEMDGCHVLEIPDGDGVASDDDNDGLYLLGAYAGAEGELESHIRGSVFARGEDDGVDHNDALVTIEGCWIEGFAHEGVAASSGRRVRVADTVVTGCDQGIEAGYGAPQVLVEHALVFGNRHGLRYGDSYDWETAGRLEVSHTVAVGNEVNVRNLVRATGEPAPEAVVVRCSAVDSPEWDGVAGNVSGQPPWDLAGVVAAPPPPDPACGGEPLGPRL